MENIFDVDMRDLKKLRDFFKKAPRDFERATANVLNTLAFKTRENDIRNLSANLIIRNQQFLKSSIIVQKAKSGRLENQVAIVATIERPRFTGWKEQEGMATADKPRTATTVARGGSRKGMIKQGYRLKSSNKFYRPEQFKGKTLQQSFGFMMRVLNTRGSSQFLISNSIQTRRGTLGKGLYQLKGHKIQRLQSFTYNKKTKQYHFRTESIKQLRFATDIKKVWQTSIDYVVNKYK